MEGYMVSSAAPGWYPEPGSGMQRWWDGNQWTQYASGAVAQVGTTTGTNGFGVASLVLGIIGLLFSWLVFFSILSILAIIFGAVGMKQARERNQGRGMAIAGLILGIVAAAIAAVVIIIAATATTAVTTTY